MKKESDDKKKLHPVIRLLIEIVIGFVVGVAILGIIAYARVAKVNNLAKKAQEFAIEEDYNNAKDCYDKIFNRGQYKITPSQNENINSFRGLWMDTLDFIDRGAYNNAIIKARSEEHKLLEVLYQKDSYVLVDVQMALADAVIGGGYNDEVPEYGDYSYVDFISACGTDRRQYITNVLGTSNPTKFSDEFISWSEYWDGVYAKDCEIRVKWGRPVSNVGYALSVYVQGDGFYGYPIYAGVEPNAIYSNYK